MIQVLRLHTTNAPNTVQLSFGLTAKMARAKQLLTTTLEHFQTLIFTTTRICLSRPRVISSSGARCSIRPNTKAHDCTTCCICEPCQRAPESAPARGCCKKISGQNKSNRTISVGHFGVGTSLHFSRQNTGRRTPCPV